MRKIEFLPTVYAGNTDNIYDIKIYNNDIVLIVTKLDSFILQLTVDHIKNILNSPNYTGEDSSYLLQFSLNEVVINYDKGSKYHIDEAFLEALRRVCNLHISFKYKHSNRISTCSKRLFGTLSIEIDDNENIPTKVILNPLPFFFELIILRDYKLLQQILFSQDLYDAEV